MLAPQGSAGSARRFPGGEQCDFDCDADHATKVRKAPRAAPTPAAAPISNRKAIIAVPTLDRLKRSKTAPSHRRTVSVAEDSTAALALGEPLTDTSTTPMSAGSATGDGANFGAGAGMLGAGAAADLSMAWNDGEEDQRSPLGTSLGSSLGTSLSTSAASSVDKKALPASSELRLAPLPFPFPSALGPA